MVQRIDIPDFILVAQPTVRWLIEGFTGTWQTEVERAPESTVTPGTADAAKALQLGAFGPSDPLVVTDLPPSTDKWFYRFRHTGEGFTASPWSTFSCVEPAVVITERRGGGGGGVDIPVPDFPIDPVYIAPGPGGADSTKSPSTGQWSTCPRLRHDMADVDDRVVVRFLGKTSSGDPDDASGIPRQVASTSITVADNICELTSRGHASTAFGVTRSTCPLPVLTATGGSTSLSKVARVAGAKFLGADSTVQFTRSQFVLAPGLDSTGTRAAFYQWNLPRDATLHEFSALVSTLSSALTQLTIETFQGDDDGTLVSLATLTRASSGDKVTLTSSSFDVIVGASSARTIHSVVTFTKDDALSGDQFFWADLDYTVDDLGTGI